MTITQIRLLTIFVSDLDRAKRFYTDSLGLAVVRDLVEGPVRWLQLAAGQRTPGILLMPGRHRGDPGELPGVQLETDDLDAECARLRAARVPVDGPHERPWGRDATFTDPDGNVFILVTPESGG
jgi:catechol 2,3-dioxygenase-like lactoylglutathione lyase family enzyme